MLEGITRLFLLSIFRFIQDKVGKHCDLLAVSPRWLKSKLIFSPIKAADLWKVNLIKEVTDLKQGVLPLEPGSVSDDPFTKEQLQDIANFVSSNWLPLLDNNVCKLEMSLNWHWIGIDIKKRPF